MDYINKVQVDGTDYILSNLTDGTHTVSLPKVNADDEFVVKSTQISKTSQLTNDSGFLTEHQSIKTVNGKSLIGTGSITISGGFLCAISGSGTDADPYVCDKSYSEILQAVNGGFIPYCYYPKTTSYGNGSNNLMCVYQSYEVSSDSKYIVFNNDMTGKYTHGSYNGYLVFVYESGAVETRWITYDMVNTVNGKTCDVTLKTSDLENDSGYATQTWVTSQIQSAVNQSWEASY